MRYWIFLIAVAAFLLACAGPFDVAGGEPAPKFINLDKLNTDADEEDPCPTPDGYGLLYASKSRSSYDIYVSKRTSLKVPFGPGKPFIADKVADERAPFQWRDRFYFATNEVPDKKFEKLKNFDLMMQIGYQRATPLLGEINTPANEMYPWITPSGGEFYFSRKMRDGYKLFVAKGPVPGPIGNAKPVGFPLDFHRATIAKDSLTMYLQGPLEDDEDDRIGIFRSTRTKVGEPWSKPTPVKALNHPKSKKGDMQPALTPDGTHLYFVSDRPGGKGGLDIWWVATKELK